MKVGFTGTRKGMTIGQYQAVKSLLSDATEVHHGCCVGADSQAHTLALELSIPLHLHPPTKKHFQAKLEPHQQHAWYAPKSYFERNRDIIDSTDWLIATPKEMKEQSQGGTWYTIRYARMQKKPLAIVWPSGTITYEHLKVENMIKPGIHIQGRISGEIYVGPDSQKRLYCEDVAWDGGDGGIAPGMGGWVVFVQGDGSMLGDTVSRGLFWNKVDAELFAEALKRTK